MAHYSVAQWNITLKGKIYFSTAYSGTFSASILLEYKYPVEEPSTQQEIGDSSEATVAAKSIFLHKRTM